MSERNETKRLVIVCHPLQMGGTEKTIVNLIQNLKKSYDIKLITLGQNKAENEYYKLGREITRHKVKCRGTLYSYIRAILKMRQIVRRENASAIIAFLSVPAIITLIATIFTNKKVLVSERTSPKNTEGVAKHWKFARVLTYSLLAKKLIVQSEKIKEEFNYVRGKYKVVIPNAADCKKLHEEKSKRGNRSDEPLKLIYIGRYEHQKGIDILLRTMAQIEELEPKIKVNLKMVGEGTQGKNYKKYILDNDLEKIISMHNKAKNQEEVYKYMEESDFIVIPSRWEGLPNVLIEAFACGTPVIASKNASSELVVDGKNGFIMEELNEISLIDCIVKAINCQANIASMRKESYATSKQFKPDSIYKKWRDELD